MDAAERKDKTLTFKKLSAGCERKPGAGFAHLARALTEGNATGAKRHLDHDFLCHAVTAQAGIIRVTLGKLERGEIGTVSVRTPDLLLNALGYALDFRERKKGFGIPTLDELAE